MIFNKFFHGLHIFFKKCQTSKERTIMKIKDYIINNFKDDDLNTLRTTISECVNEEDEETLPGLGVFMELIWNGSDEDTKKSMLDILLKEIEKNK